MTYNFCAGPAILADSVLEKAQEKLLDFKDGISILSISHRDPAFEALGEGIKTKLRAILELPDDYDILLMQGGATLQFSAIPMNFGKGKKAAYINTGIWSQKAIDEAQKCLEVVEIDQGYRSAGQQRFDAALLNDVEYIHYTDNETIDGVEFNYAPEAKGVPIICDMSSSFLSKAIDITKFDLIYAGAQKNLGPSGLTIVIVKKSLLVKVDSDLLPVVMDYKKTAAADSLLNTPVTFTWQVVDLVLEWFNEAGGLSYFGPANQEKAAMLYQAIDRLSLFSNKLPQNVRSNMNVVFQLLSDELTKQFLQEADVAGFYGLKGHRSVGGCRASLYNAMDLAGVKALVDFMETFNEKHK